MAQQDPYATLAKPLPNDPYAAIAQSLAPPVESQGFFSSAADSSGLSSLGNAIMHPIDAAAGIPGAISGMIKNTTDNVRQGVADYQKSGLSEATRRDFGRAVPLVGPVLAKAQAQHDAGNDAGMAGTLGGFVGGGVAPELAIKGAGLGLQGLGKTAEIGTGITKDSLKIAGTRMLTPGTPAELLQKAVRPPVSYGDFGKDIETLTPQIQATSGTNPGLKGLGKVLGDVKATSIQNYRNLLDPISHFKVDGSPIADAQMQSIPITDRIEQPAKLNPGTPGRMKVINAPGGEGSTLTMGSMVGGRAPSLEGGIMQRTAEKADNFRQEMPLGVVDDVRAHTNADLQSIWNKNGGDRYAALADSENARKFATNSAARDLTYDSIARLNAAGRTDGGIGVRAIQANQEIYGAANNLDDVLNKRGIVYGRQAPISLPESIAATGGKGLTSTVADFMTQRLLKSITNPNALVNAAVDRMESPDALQFKPRPGMLTNGISTTGQAAQSLGKSLLNGPRLPNPLMFRRGDAKQ